MKTEFGTAGDVRDVDLLAAFVAFWRDRTSGVVSFVRAGGTAAFSLSEGEVVTVSSSEPRFESAAILVRAGKLDAAALERLAVPEGSDAALAALQAGILTKREWRWGEKIRAIEILADLLSWSDGKYYFDSDSRPRSGEFNLAIPRLLLELFLRSRDRHFVEHQLGPTDVPLVRSEEFDREFTTFGLTADAESVVRLIDGRASAAEIASAAPADEFAVRKLLAALRTLGLVRAADASVTETPVPVPAWDSFPTTPMRTDEVELPEPAGVASEDAVTRRIDGLAASEPPSEPDLDALSEDRWPEREREREGDAEPLPSDAEVLGAYPISSSERTASGEEEPAADGGPLFDPLPPSEGLPPEEAPEKSRLGATLMWTFAGLIVLVAGLLYLRSRPVSTGTAGPSIAATPTESAPVATRPPAPTSAGAPLSAAGALPTAVAAAPTPAGGVRRPTAVAAAPAPSPRPTAAVARVVATAKPAAPTPAPRIAAIKPTTVPYPTARPAAGAPAAAPRAETPPSGGRSAWIARANRDRRRLATERSTHYSIQLELACEIPSLTEAWRHDRPAGSMWLLTAPHGGRECFRVLWGRYPSIDAAKRAKPRIPAFFQTATNHPAVVSVR